MRRVNQLFCTFDPVDIPAVVHSCVGNSAALQSGELANCAACIRIWFRTWLAKRLDNGFASKKANAPSLVLMAVVSMRHLALWEAKKNFEFFAEVYNQNCIQR